MTVKGRVNLLQYKFYLIHFISHFKTFLLYLLKPFYFLSSQKINFRIYLHKQGGLNKMTVLLKTKAMLTRLLFLTHGITSVHLVIQEHGEYVKHMFLYIPVVALVAEMFMMLKRKKWEFEYIWPTGFCYITTVIPVIWITELELFKARLYKRDKLNTTLFSTHSQKEMEGRLYLSDMEFSNEVFGRKICELGLFIGLLIGRWLTPRGSITRDGLSALLLGYVGTTSDHLRNI